jgi:isocitrate dehydrogenase
MTHQGDRISIDNRLQLQVPDHPIIPFIEGDGTGPTSGAPASGSSTPPSKRPTAASEDRWKEVLAGEKAFKQFNNWLPDETLDAFRTYLVGIKGRSPRRSAAASAR